MTPASPVGAALAQVRERIRRAGGDPGEITIVAVTKGQGPETVHEALEAGLSDIGENYASELLEKAAALRGLSKPVAGAEPAASPEQALPGPRWHFIGAIQTNKVRPLAPVVHTWQAVDRLSEAEAIAAAAPAARVFVQVLLGGGPGRAGVSVLDLDGLVEGVAERVTVGGLMAVGPPGPPEAARAGFRMVAAAARRLGLPEVSMGMSADLEVAVQEGATMLRLGTALFGRRPTPGGRR